MVISVPVIASGIEIGLALAGCTAAHSRGSRAEGTNEGTAYPTPVYLGEVCPQSTPGLTGDKVSPLCASLVTVCVEVSAPKMASTESKTDAVAEHGDVAQIEAGSLPGHEKINISGVTAVHRNEIPEGYYKSWTFIGTFAAICINSACAYASFGFPTNLLSIINEDLGTFSLWCVVLDSALTSRQGQILTMCGYRSYGQLARRLFLR